MNAEKLYQSLNAGPAQVRIVAAFHHWNMELENRFKLEKLNLQCQYGVDSEEAAESWLYHGTTADNIHSIFEDNFKLDRIRSGAFGWGIYFGELPQTAMFYAHSRDQRQKEVLNVVLCKVLKGKSSVDDFGCCKGSRNALQMFQFGGSYWTSAISSQDTFCDSHYVPKCKYVVIFNPDRILPMYELQIKLNRKE